MPTVKVLIGLGHFWPRLPTVKVFDFLAFSAKDTNGERCFFHGHFWPWITTVKVFDFEHYWPRLAMMKVFVFSLLFLSNLMFILQETPYYLSSLTRFFL